MSFLSMRKYHTNKKYRLMAVLFLGGLEEIRTPDPHNANVVRSQLRYKPITPKIILPYFGFVKEKEHFAIAPIV